MERILPAGIRTARLILREPASADAAGIFRAYAQDPQVCRYLAWAPHASESITRTFVDGCIDAWRAGNPIPYMITLHDAGAVIGMLEARIERATIDIGYVLARSHWGMGLVPEAIRSLAAVASAGGRIDRLQATCDVDNVASQRALEKAGFRRECRLERHMVHPNIGSEPRDCFLYARGPGPGPAVCEAAPATEQR